MGEGSIYTGKDIYLEDMGWRGGCRIHVSVDTVCYKQHNSFIPQIYGRQEIRWLCSRTGSEQPFKSQTFRSHIVWSLALAFDWLAWLAQAAVCFHSALSNSFKLTDMLGELQVCQHCMIIPLWRSGDLLEVFEWGLACLTPHTLKSTSAKSKLNRTPMHVAPLPMQV